MHKSAVHPSPVTSETPPDLSQSIPLRRAVYIHVSDLTSAYNIDHGRLEHELARVNDETKNKFFETPLQGVPTELDTGANQRRLPPPRTGYNLCV
jgi:hypothetical protein